MENCKFYTVFNKTKVYSGNKKQEMAEAQGLKVVLMLTTLQAIKNWQRLKKVSISKDVKNHTIFDRWSISKRKENLFN